jgi:esterase/lipase superfamily enzyme
MIEQRLTTLLEQALHDRALRRVGDGAPPRPADVTAEPALEHEPATAPAPAPAPRPAPAPPPATAAPRADQTEVYRVWFATNRRPKDPGDFNRGFTASPEDDHTLVHYGTCDVEIPRSHKFGSLGSSFLVRAITRTDDRLKLETVSALAEELFWEGVKQRLQQLPDAERQALVFIHGYSTSFKSAALRAAQIGADLKAPGVTAFFSWPSRGRLLGYLMDDARIEASEAAITEFLVRFANDVGAHRLHVIAHSMGNLGLLRAMQHILADAQRRTNVRFGQVFLAAPDVDTRLFKQLAIAYPELTRRTTVYISPRDLALRVSRWLRGREARVGFAPPITVVPGIDTVWVPDFRLDLLGHSYYAKAAGVLHDMHDLLRIDSAPAGRARLTADVNGDGQQYWVMRR